ncbi:MAG: hypothetical protein ACOVOR_04940 [Rhabdochlamydiaceae bacterium]
MTNPMFSFLKYVFAAPILGWGLTLCLFQILDALGFKYNKGHKSKCWIHLSCVVVIFAVLVTCFS